MEGRLVAILTACLLLSFSYRGDAEHCSVSGLAVTQTAMPRKDGGYRQYKVTVVNKCICSQLNVKLVCTGFDPSVRIDPAGMITSGGDKAFCTLNGGRPLRKDATVTFSYAWSTQISFKPFGSTIACSAEPLPA